MKPLSIRKRRIYFYTFVGIFLLVIPFIILYTSGYRIGSGFGLVQTGGIYINAPEAGADIYLDGKKETTTNLFRRDEFIQNLRPKTYEVLVSKEGYWPWAKAVLVEERRVSEAIAFMVAKEPDGELITRTLRDEDGESTDEPNPEYTHAVELLDTPPEDRDLDLDDEELEHLEVISERGRVGLWREGMELFAMWLDDQDSIPIFFCRNKDKEKCPTEVSVFSGNTNIKAMDFYPGREDVIIMAVNEGIFAIEIDTRSPQNFQPIYKGQNPTFARDGSTLYIRDQNRIFKIEI